MFAGYGDGQRCDGCEMPISAAQVEWEFIAAQGQTVRFHLGCAALWEADRRRRGWVTTTRHVGKSRGSLALSPLGG